VDPLAQNIYSSQLMLGSGGCNRKLTDLASGGVEERDGGGGGLPHYDRNWCLQVVREKIFRRLRQELPYEIDVVPKEYATLKDDSLLFRHNIIVSSEIVSTFPHSRSPLFP